MKLHSVRLTKGVAAEGIWVSAMHRRRAPSTAIAAHFLPCGQPIPPDPVGIGETATTQDGTLIVKR
jgi:hypothetical protein